jgi:Family of unknown function (DUF5361)
VAGYRWADVGTKRFPFDQFLSFVFHAPPGTALYHSINQGWTVNDYLTTDVLEDLDLLLWTKTKDAQKNRNRPKRRPRPTSEQAKSGKQKNETMTVEEYMKRTGMSVVETEGR